MNKTRKRQLHIRNKLIAAVAMLLVSSIMMVSTTYAWFTLSTAPEVQGITTTVGTNGNLEIALSPLNGDAGSIKSSVGDSGADWFVKNTTWGNLVDLSSSEYELDKVALMPSQLVISDNKIDISTGGLAYPQYGSDGRITTLAAGTSIGGKIAETEEGATRKLTEDFRLGLVDGYGVRAVGTSSGLTETQRIFNAGVSALRTGMNQASGVASEVMNTKGQALANMMVEHAMAAEGATEDYKAYMGDLDALIASLEQSVGHIDSAMKGAMKAIAATKVTGEPLKAVVSTIDQKTIPQLYESLPTEFGGAIPELDTVKTKRDAIATAVSNARAKYAAIDSTDGVTWEEVNVVVADLMNVEHITINGYSYAQIQADKSGLLQSLMGNGMVVNIKLNAGSGIYYQIHEIASKIYAAPTMTIDTDKLSASLGMGVQEVSTVIETTYEGSTLLNLALVKVSGMTAKPEEGVEGGTVSTLDVYYGYILDFVFRTNAAGSKLQLQTEGVNRVYSSDGSEATMGGGSTITFPVPVGVDAGTVKGMIEGIRVVFFDTKTGEVYGVAKATTITPESTDAGNSFVGKLELCEIGMNGTYASAGDAKGSAELCALNQNAPKAVSVLVSLDGNEITNSDILADGNISGVLNLQFSSSATLVPMDNNALKTMKSFDVKVGDVKIGTVEENGTFTRTFDQKAVSAVAVKMNGTDLDSTKYSYTNGVLTVPNVTGELVLTITSAEINVTHTVDTEGNATFTGNAKATVAKDYTFKVTPADGKVIKKVTYTVAGNHAVEISGTDGSYTVPAAAVTGDITINVTTGEASSSETTTPSESQEPSTGE